MPTEAPPAPDQKAQEDVSLNDDQTIVRLRPKQERATKSRSLTVTLTLRNGIKGRASICRWIEAPLDNSLWKRTSAPWALANC